MILRIVRTDELPTKFEVTKHAFAQAHGRFKKSVRNKDVDLLLAEVALTGDFYHKPVITKDGVSYAKQTKGVVVYVQVAMNEDGSLHDTGYITTVGTPGGKDA